LSDREAFVLAGVNFEQEVDALIDGIRRGQLSPLRHAGDRQPPAGPGTLPPAKRRRRMKESTV
jgi:hypothetical protein